jgi:hypothetical protein
MAYLEQSVIDFGGIALRYGGFYGDDNDGWAELVRKRWFPIVGEWRRHHLLDPPRGRGSSNCAGS